MSRTVTTSSSLLAVGDLHQSKTMHGRSRAAFAIDSCLDNAGPDGRGDLEVETLISSVSYRLDMF